MKTNHNRGTSKRRDPKPFQKADHSSARPVRKGKPTKRFIVVDRDAKRRTHRIEREDADELIRRGLEDRDIDRQVIAELEREHEEEE